MMRLVWIGLATALLVLPAVARASHVRGYVRHSTGRYVAPHYRSTPDHMRMNNYSAKGNVNPFTGKEGTKK